jgi:hypothetical protein
LPTFYSITFSEGITRIKLFKRPTKAQVQSIMNEVAIHHAYEKRLWDLSEGDFIFPLEDLEEIAHFGKGKMTRPNKMAVLAPNDLNFGIMRQFEVFRANEHHTRFRVFRTEREAIDWLNS